MSIEPKCTMLFQPLTENTCPVGLDLFMSLVDVLWGSSKCIKIPMWSTAFAKDDADIGCIPGLQLRINLRDDTPVQKSYYAIPKPLY